MKALSGSPCFSEGGITGASDKTWAMSRSTRLPGMFTVLLFTGMVGIFFSNWFAQSWQNTAEPGKGKYSLCFSRDTDKRCCKAIIRTPLVLFWQQGKYDFQSHFKKKSERNWEKIHFDCRTIWVYIWRKLQRMTSSVSCGHKMLFETFTARWRQFTCLQKWNHSELLMKYKKPFTKKVCTCVSVCFRPIKGEV